MTLNNNVRIIKLIKVYNNNVKLIILLKMLNLIMLKKNKLNKNHKLNKNKIYRNLYNKTN